MEKCNWKHSVTLKQRMVLCLAAFFAAFALQLALNGYQARAVQQVQDDQMGNFNAISRFQGGVESSISILEAYRWENGETEEMLEKLQAACSTSIARYREPDFARQALWCESGRAAQSERRDRGRYRV